MIVGYIKGQSLSLSSPTIASGTIDHLTAFFTFFTSEWEQCNEIWVHFSQGDTVYDAEIIEGKVNKDQHINLDKGEWEVYVHGNVTANGEVIERITTEKETLFVKESGIVDGTPFPSVEESTAEKILAKAQYAVEVAEGVREDFDEMPTGGLTPEQEAEIQANTAARHTHANKDTLDKLGESGEILTYDGKKVVDSSVLAVVKEQKQLESLSDKSLLCYVLTDRIGFVPVTLEAGVVYGGLADYKDRETIYIDPLLQNFFPCSAFTVTTEKVLLNEGGNEYCHYEFSTDGATYFYFKYFVNDEPFWVRLYNATDDMLIVDDITFPVGWSNYSAKYNEVMEIPIFTDSDYYMYFDVHSLKFSNDDYFNELQNVFSAERTYGSVRGYYQYYNSKWQKINFGQISITSNSAAESISANSAAIELLQKQFTAFEGEVTEIEAMIDESGVLDE